MPDFGLLARCEVRDEPAATYDGARTYCERPPFSDHGGKPMLPTVRSGHTPSSRLDASEAISPELALVDPEIRRRARETLPSGPGTSRVPGGHLPSARSLVRGPVAPTHSADTVAMRPASTTVRGWLLPVAFLAGAALVLATARPATLDADRRDEPTAIERQRPLRGSDLSLRRNAAVSPRRTATPVSAQREPIARPAAQRAKRRTPRTPARTQIAWTFVWPAHPGASYYDVKFLQGRNTIFEAWPRRPRLVVPAHGVSRGRPFRFSRGRYRWVVRPGFGPQAHRRYGPPIVLSGWTVGPESR